MFAYDIVDSDNTARATLRNRLDEFKSKLDHGLRQRSALTYLQKHRYRSVQPIISIRDQTLQYESQTERQDFSQSDTF